MPRSALPVDRRAGRDVVADIGDVDLQRIIAVGQLVHPNGVVEIARRLAVDGDDIEGAESRGGRQSSAASISAGCARACSKTSAEIRAADDACE